MINFNEPTYTGREPEYINRVINVNHMMCGDGEFTKLCNKWLREKVRVSEALLTTSCTHALEMAALLCGIREGDEVIMPSFTFCSTADAIVLRGGVPVFVDIRPDTMNINEELIEEAITSRTRAIIPVHYAGVGCEMDRIMEIARDHSLYVIEDAAQAIMAEYKGRPRGGFGDYGCLSFHETKNFTMGEGGAILIRDRQNVEAAEVLREKGTNRAKFFRGQIDKYTWIDRGSSYLPSEMNASYLWAQLETADSINGDRIRKWDMYYDLLKDLGEKECIGLPFVPSYCRHNAHMFYIKAKDLSERSRLIGFLKENGIQAVFHYIPLHGSPAGLKYGRMSGEDIYTTRESDRLLRLPMHYNLTDTDIEYICSKIHEFYEV